MQPFDMRHAVPAGDDKAQRKPMLRSQRLAVHLVSDEDFIATRIGHGQAALVVLLDATLHSSIEAGEDNLDGVGERARGLKQRSERRPGPLRVADSLQDPGLADRTWSEMSSPIAGALEGHHDADPG